jgi:hypothetical protein
VLLVNEIGVSFVDEVSRDRMVLWRSEALASKFGI